MDDIRAASLQSWTAVAPDWGELTDHVDRQLQPAADWIIRAVALEPGDRVLELAGGPGTLSMLAAQAVAPGGRVIHSDFSEAMVEVARARVDQAGVDRVEFRVIDAEQIDLPDGAVDAVICRMGYMLMADPAAALRETQRVLAPDGRVGLAVWSTAEANPWAALAMRAVGAELGTPPPPPDAPGTLWSLADPARLTGLMEDARLRAIDTELLDATLEFESAEQWIDTTRRLAGPLRALFANVDDDTRVAIERRMRELAEPYIQPDGGVSMPQQMLVAAARK